MFQCYARQYSIDEKLVILHYLYGVAFGPLPSGDITQITPQTHLFSINVRLFRYTAFLRFGNMEEKKKQTPL